RLLRATAAPVPSNVVVQMRENDVDRVPVAQPLQCICGGLDRVAQTADHPPVEHGGFRFPNCFLRAQFSRLSYQSGESLLNRRGEAFTKVRVLAQFRCRHDSYADRIGSELGDSLAERDYVLK